VPDQLVIEIVGAIEAFCDRILIVRHKREPIKTLPSKCLQFGYEHLSINATSDEIIDDLVGKRYFGRDSEWLVILSPCGGISRDRFASIVATGRSISADGISLLKMEDYLATRRASR
jgi:hypothetical protein